MRYLSVCSGVECASVAWEPLGWTPVAFSEVEPFPCAVLAHRFPTVPNLGDLTRWREWPRELLVQADVLIGGTPCQAFSVAGKRGGMGDERGALSQTFAELADAIDDLRVDAGLEPCTVVWENVPGVFSDRTNGFGCLLGALAGSGTALAQPDDGSWPNAGVVAGPRRVAAWRVLDAQHFGVAQRRRRVFLLARGGAGAWTCADALLPLGKSLRGNPATGRAARKGATADAAGGVASLFNAEGGGADGVTLTASNVGRHVNNQTPLLAKPLGAHHPRNDLDNETYVAAPPIAFNWQNGGGYGNANEGLGITEDGTGPLSRSQVQAVVSVALRGREGGNMAELGDDKSTTLRGGGGGSDKAHVLSFDLAQITSKANRTRVEPDAPSSTLAKDSAMHTAGGFGVRRLTPVECERLQGLPDRWTDVPYRGKPAADGPRYKAIGNGMAAPVVRWVGHRIEVTL